MGTDTKTCPRCAEEIKAAAVVCRFCRYGFADQLPIPPRPTGLPPEGITTALAPDETLFVWSPCLFGWAQGAIAVTSHRVLFAAGSVPSLDNPLSVQHPIDRNRKATVGGESSSIPEGCRPDGTVVIMFEGNMGFNIHGLNPEVAKEIGATVVSGLIDRAFGDNPEMQRTLRERHERIAARASALALSPDVRIKGCKYLGGFSGFGGGYSRYSLVFSAKSIDIRQGGTTYRSITSPQAAGVGILAGPGRRGSSVIVLSLATGESGHFEVKNASVAELQALLSGWAAGH